MNKAVMFLMTDRLSHFSAALVSAGIDHACYHDCIHVDLPGEFGIMELKVWPDGDDSIGLLDGDFHTHSSVLAVEYETTPALAFAKLLKEISQSKLLLIEETAPDGRRRKTVEDSIQEYLRYLPEGTTYRVANET